MKLYRPIVKICQDGRAQEYKAKFLVLKHHKQSFKVDCFVDDMYFIAVAQPDIEKIDIEGIRFEEYSFTPIKDLLKYIGTHLLR